MATVIAALGLVAPTSASATAADAADVVQEVEHSVAVHMTDVAMDAVAAGDVIVHAPAVDLEESKAAVLALSGDDETFTSVSVPVGGEHSLTSNVTIVFDEDENVVQYSESLLERNGSDNFRITAYTDGELTKSQDTDIPFVPDSELMKDLHFSGPISALDSTSASTLATSKSTSACLSATLGITGTLGIAIALACGGSCAGGAVPICAACIGAYAVVHGAGITAVAACF
ncbi:hypothetical protein [Isoptericola croceus]|uniref:hypothetical protein n=1 Tax=Isoptericola croceus TaxID=3031406 RepID=UPI0023F9EE86|nr:hypothetical protein [Isoptericola croceus]